MIISKSRANAKASTGKRSKNTKKAKVLELEEYLHKRDFSAACVLLEFRCHSEGRQPKTLEWLAYCYFHNREHDRALKIYKELLNAVDPDPIYRVYAAACSYYMGLYEEAELEAQKGPDVPLRTRLLFHLSHKLGNEDKLMEYHQKLTETTEDQLTLASIHYLRSHFQEATDIYKRLLLENRDFLALNVYVALCYSKLDYYDVSLEILSVHLQTCPDSAFSLNLKVISATVSVRIFFSSFWAQSPTYSCMDTALWALKKVAFTLLPPRVFHVSFLHFSRVLKLRVKMAIVTFVCEQTMLFCCREI
mmetsp:Transcript_8171/g.19566  ORF Transcript_8171/g.19566 Transcript_8171/m.19566 type:complete len:305 (+) Transcript_8171:71-985(+)